MQLRVQKSRAGGRQDDVNVVVTCTCTAPVQQLSSSYDCSQLESTVHNLYHMMVYNVKTVQLVLTCGHPWVTPFF